MLTCFLVNGWSKALCCPWDDTHWLPRFDRSYLLLELWLCAGRFLCLFSLQVCEDSRGFLLQQLFPLLTFGFGKKVLVLYGSCMSVFPCSGHLTTINEIKPTTSHEPSDAGVPSLPQEEQRCSGSLQCTSRRTEFVCQSHWAPTASRCPAFTVWLSSQCLQAFRCLHMSRVQLVTIPFLVKTSAVLFLNITTSMKFNVPKTK